MHHLLHILAYRTIVSLCLNASAQILLRFHSAVSKREHFELVQSNRSNQMHRGLDRKHSNSIQYPVFTGPTLLLLFQQQFLYHLMSKEKHCSSHVLHINQDFFRLIMVLTFKISIFVTRFSVHDLSLRSQCIVQFFQVYERQLSRWNSSWFPKYSELTRLSVICWLVGHTVNS